MIRPTLNRRPLFSLIFAAVLVPILFTGCTDPDDPGKKVPNKTPETRLSNVPPPGTISTKS